MQGTLDDRFLTIGGGDTVRLRRGAVVFSNHPKYPRIGKINNVNRTVYLQHLEVGDTKVQGRIDIATNGLVVCWTGQGGYWYWTDAVMVERVTESGRAM